MSCFSGVELESAIFHSLRISKDEKWLYFLAHIATPRSVTGPSSRARAINKVAVTIISVMHDWVQPRRFPARAHSGRYQLFVAVSFC